MRFRILPASIGLLIVCGAAASQPVIGPFPLPRDKPAAQPNLPALPSVSTTEPIPLPESVPIPGKHKHRVAPLPPDAIPTAPPPMPVALVADPLPPRDLLPPPPVPSPTPPLGPTAPAPREKSVDDLLAELEDLQAQKARLEKQEAELKATIRKRLDAQTERLKKLGVTQEAKGPDRVGRIIIEGNTKTPDKKILALLELQPGQILTYLGLEEARARFKKGKFSATVEVIPNELDSTFKDIRVKVVEPDAR